MREREIEREREKEKEREKIEIMCKYFAAAFFDGFAHTCITGQKLLCYFFRAYDYCWSGVGM